MLTLFSLVNWSNGIIMIGVFILVVIALIAILMNLMSSGKKGEDKS